MFALLATITCLFSKPHITTGVWYEGGEGEFRQNVIPSDSNAASTVYLKNFQDIAAHGVEVAVVPNSPMSHHKSILEAASKAGIKLILELGHESGSLGDMVRGKMPINKENVEQLLRRDLSPIANHPALMRVQICDEPWPQVFGLYGQVSAIIKASKTPKPTFGCIIESGGVAEFLKTTKEDVVAFDCYPLNRDTPVGDEKALNHFASVCETAGTCAHEYNAEAWAVIQCHAITGSLRFPSVNELRYMTHVALAKGCKGVFWFLYQTEWLNPEHTVSMDGLVDSAFKARPLWSEITNLTKMIREVSPLLASLHPSEVDSEVKLSGRGLVSGLQDQSGVRYLYVVNPDVKNDAIVKLSCKSYRVETVQKGYTIKDTALKLPPGGGAILRLVRTN